MMPPRTDSGPSLMWADALLARVAIGVLLGIGLASATCWAGAQLAAGVFGEGLMHSGLSDGAAAVTSLPRHWSDPADAWPAGSRAMLPGAVAYWSSTFVVAAAAALVALGLVKCWRASANGHPSALGVRPNAGFARAADLRRLRVRAPEPGRLTLGYAGRHLVAAEPRVSLAVIGPTGCGKTAGFAIPALREWLGPVIATSVKADLLDASLEHRSRGRVWIYDPTCTSGRETNAWSPLHACRTWSGAMRIAAWLCEAAQPRIDTVNDGDYWYTQARKALAPYLHAAALSDRTMRDVVRWIDIQETSEVEAVLRSHGDVDTALERLLASERATRRREQLRDEVQNAEIALVRDRLEVIGGGPGSWEAQPLSHWPIEQQQQLGERVEKKLDERIRAEFLDEAIKERRPTGALDPLIAAQSLWRKEPRLRGSVFATVENVLAGYADPGVAAAAESCEIDLEDWLSGDNTIYVVATAHEQARLRPVLTVLIQQAIRSAYERADAQGGTLVHPCLVLLDEAGNIAPLRDLPGYASTARSHGITLVSIWQDLAQIKAIYRDRAQTVLNNHRAKLFGTGIADEATLEYVSRLIGDERRTEINLSGDVHSVRRSMSEHVSYRRAAPIDVLRRVHPNDGILVYGSELPAHLRLRPWFRGDCIRGSRSHGNELG